MKWWAGIILGTLMVGAAMLPSCGSNSVPSGPPTTPVPTATFTPTVTFTSTPTPICTIVPTMTYSVFYTGVYYCGSSFGSGYNAGTVSAGQVVSVRDRNVPGFSDFINFTAGSNGYYNFYLDCFTSTNSNPGNFTLFFAGSVCGAGSGPPLSNTPVLVYTSPFPLVSGNVYELQAYSSSVTALYRLSIQGP